MTAGFKTQGAPNVPEIIVAGSSTDLKVDELHKLIKKRDDEIEKLKQKEIKLNKDLQQLRTQKAEADKLTREEE
jgi:prefoldin subunit 5